MTEATIRHEGSKKGKWGLKKKIALGVSAFTIAAAGVGGVVGYQKYSESHNIPTNGSFIFTPDSFDKNPPSRPEIVQTAPDQLPTISRHREYYQYEGGTTPDNFIAGITFRLEERPDVQRTAKIFHPDGTVEDRVITDKLLPSADLNGYLIQKELQDDGSVMLAIEIPGKDGEPFAPQDIDTKPSSIDQLREAGNAGNLNGFIVWLKLEDFVGYKMPFGFHAAWRLNDLGHKSEQMTNMPKGVFDNIRTGDPVKAWANPNISSVTQQLLDQNYRQSAGNLSYEEAQKRFLDRVNGNGATIKKMIADAQSGSAPSLGQQLREKTYTLQVSGVDFVPRAQ